MSPDRSETLPSRQPLDPTDPVGSVVPSVSPARQAWALWLAVGWAALLVGACLAIAFGRTSLLHVLDIRALFR